MAASFPCAATFWTTYTFAKRGIDNTGYNISAPVKHILAAACGSVTTSMVRNPFEVVKQQMQTGQHKSTIDAPLHIIKKQGIGGLFIGLSTLISREIPFDATQFLLYEWLKGADYNPEVKRSQWRNMLNGAIAGGVSAFITTPIDVAKTRLMT